MFRIKYGRAFKVIALATAFTTIGFEGAIAGIPVPPVLSSVDGNGVDLVSGQVTISTLDISIGGSGSGLSRVGSGYSAPTGDNFFGAINNDGSGNLTVSLGDDSELFNLVSGAYQSASGSANTLSCASGTCTYTLKDGTVVSYDTSLTSAYGIQANYAMLTSITKPDGEVISLTYRSTGSPGSNSSYALSVSSTLGWMLKYHVAGDLSSNYFPVKVEAINTSVDYCDPTALTCAGATVSWPYVLISSYGPTDALGNHTDFGSGMNAPTSIVSQLGVTKTITYYTSGTYNGWVHTVAIAGSTWTYAYSVTGSSPNRIQTTTVTDPNGGVRTLTAAIDKSQVVSDTDALSRKVSYTYYTTTGSGAFKSAVQRVIAPDATYSGSTLTGGYKEYAYDSRGNVTSESVTPKGGGTAIVTSATYASSCTNTKTCNKPLTTTDAGGVTATYTYDSSSGNVATVTLPAVSSVAPQVRYTYTQQTPYIKNSSGSLVASTPVWRLTTVSSCMTTSSCSGTSDERKTITTYATNNVLPDTVTVARGDANLGVAATSTNEYRKTTLAYDNFGNVVSVDGPITGTSDATYYFYDVLGRQTGMIGMDPDDTGSLPRQGSSTTYNNDGQVTAVTRGSVTGTTSSALSSMTVQDKSATEYSTSTGLPTVSRYYPGTSTTPQSVTQTSYDSLFRVDCVAQRLNPSVFTSLPSSACTQGTAGSDGADRIVKYSYNAIGALLTSLSGYGVAQRQDVVKTYNSNGILATLADDKGNLTSYTYDTFNRQTKVCYPNKTTAMASSTTDCAQVAYTGARPTTRTLRDGQTIGLSYDALGRVSAVSSGVTESYAYDNFSHVTSHTANSLTETYTYDPLNGLVSDAQPTGTVGYAYDQYGRRSWLSYPSNGGHTFYLGYSFFNDGTLWSEQTAYNGGSSVTRAQFYQDSFGRLDYLTLGASGQVTVDPTYDTSSRLSNLGINLTGTSYDSAWGYSYNAADQITSRTQTGSSSYNYVAPSNTTTTYAVNGLNQHTTVNSATFTYDGRGNLTSDGSATYSYNAYNLLTSVVQSGVTATLTYDASNRLASLAKSGTTTKFLYDGSDLIAEYDGSGTLLRRYVHGAGTDQPLVWFEGTDDSTPKYLSTDQLGSVTAVADDSGNALGVNTYDEYGLPSSGNLGRFQYTGQTWLPEVGLYYYKARMYAPSLGRFLQADPIGYGDGMNIYAYVGGDPVNSFDPSGTELVVPGHPRTWISGDGIAGAYDMISQAHSFIPDSSIEAISNNGTVVVVGKVNRITIPVSILYRYKNKSAVRNSSPTVEDSDTQDNADHQEKCEELKKQEKMKAAEILAATGGGVAGFTYMRLVKSPKIVESFLTLTLGLDLISIAILYWEQADIEDKLSKEGCE